MTPTRVVPWTKELLDREAKIGRTLAGGHIPSIAKAVMAHPELREAITLRFFDSIDNECTKLCEKTSPPSLLQQIPVTDLGSFTWINFINEFETKAPTLLQILRTVTSHNDHRNKRKCGAAHHPGICMAVAVILNERSQKMAGIQSLVSMILFASHAEKQVYLYFCALIMHSQVLFQLVYTATCTLFDIISQNMHSTSSKFIIILYVV